MPHYMADCWTSAPTAIRPDESFRIAASSDDEAIREAQNIGAWKTLTRLRVREVKRLGDRVIYDAQSEALKARP